MRRYNLFLVALFFVATSLLATLPPSSSVRGATEVEELQKTIDSKNAQIKEIQSKIEVYKKTIEKKRLERLSLSNQVSLIENRIEKAQLDINATNLLLEEIGLEIKTVELAIEEKAQHIRRESKVIAQLIRSLQSYDQKNIIEVLASQKNFSEFFQNVQQVRHVQEALADATKLLKKAKEELENARAEKERKKETLAQLQTALAAKKESLASQKNVKVNLIDQTAASEQKFTALVGNLRKEYEAIEGDIATTERQLRKKLEAKDAFPDGGDGSFGWPVPSKVITAYFHDPDYPYRHVFEHSAIDIRAAQGTPVRASSSGFIGRARRCTSHLCYSYVLIVHQNKISTVYGHLSSIGVNEGDFVAKGDIIGYSGGTPKTIGAGPFVTGAHLHFETRVNGIPVDPLNYVRQ